MSKICTEAKENNIKVIVDVVLNHVAGINSGLLLPHERVRIRDREFYKDSILIEDWKSREQVINGCIGVPCLKLENFKLQDIIIKFLNSLIDCGVEGFRFDAGKHIKLPEEGSEFWVRVLKKLKRNDLFNYAEIIFEDKETIFKYTKYIKVLTENKEINSDKIVSFIESHDSYLEFGYTRKLSDRDIIEGYGKICEIYKNTLFYARPFNNTWKNEEIKRINKKEKIS